MDYIFNAIVLNKILYALPVYFGYLTEGQKQMLRVCYTELIVEDLPHIVTIWTLWQRALSTISVVTVATVHTALIICILPNLSHRVP